MRAASARRPFTDLRKIGMIKRTSTHVIDTRAVRNVISTMPDNWLVRGLEERDYGIDLKVELFQGESPTGGFALIQVKGTEAGFDATDSLQGFPTRTLEYARLFPEPFFIFHTSLKNKTTRFVWAQKYVDCRLSVDNKQWATQAATTIHFPMENVLGSDEGNRKIEDIIDLLAVRMSGLDFLADYEQLKIHWASCKAGIPALLVQCAEGAARLSEHQKFLDRYCRGAIALDLGKLKSEFNWFQGRRLDDSALGNINQAFDMLEALKMSFLSERDRDQFEEEESSSSPY